MKSDRFLKHLLAVFLAGLAAYAGLFYGIERWRTHSGPWEVRFARSAGNGPVLHLDQPLLGITNVQITFVGEAAPAGPVALVTFAEARRVPFDVPFGRCVFLDTTSLPGAVVMELFGHQIQLLPRVLTIDGQDHAWRSGEVISLPRTNAPTRQSQS